MCEECESFHDRSGEIKTEVSLENEDPEYQNFLLQRYEERIERLQ